MFRVFAQLECFCSSFRVNIGLLAASLIKTLPPQPDKVPMKYIEVCDHLEEKKEKKYKWSVYFSKAL